MAELIGNVVQKFLTEVDFNKTIIKHFFTELTALTLLCIRAWQKRFQFNAENRGRITENKPWISYHIWLLGPYILTCSVRHFLGTDLTDSTFMNYIQGVIDETTAKMAILSYEWFYIVALLVLFGLIYLVIGFIVNIKYIHSFLAANFNR